MYARLVGSTENDIAQHRLLQERVRHLTAEVLLAEVTPEKARGSMIDIHIYDVVIIHIVHPHSIFIIGTLEHLIGCRIDLCIKMILLCSKSHDGVFPNQLSLIEHHGLLMLERTEIGLVIGLHQPEHISILSLELEEMSGLFHDSIANITGATYHQGVCRHIKIGRHTGRVWIINSVALHPKDHILVILVNPHALQHLLGLHVFFERFLLGTFLTGRKHHQAPYDQ